MHRSVVLSLFLVSLVTSLLAGQEPPASGMNRIGPDARVMILVPVEDQVTWLDDAFLCAIPAALQLGERTGTQDPIVLAVEAEQPFRPELLDFLRRYEPTKLIWLGPELPEFPVSKTARLEAMQVSSGEIAAATISTYAFAGGYDKVVLYDSSNRTDALVAAAFAARIGAPLFPWSGKKFALDTHRTLAMQGVKKAYFIGEGEAPVIGAFTKASTTPSDKDVTYPGARVERIKTAKDVAHWLTKNRHPVEYLAVVNPDDASAGRDRNLALAAPLLAAAHQGVVVPIELETHWKRSFVASEILEKKPSGAADSSQGWRQGVIQLENHKDTPFVTGIDSEDGRWWMQLDRNRDGRYSGKKEKPVFTGDNFPLADLHWTADLDADEKKRGGAIWMTTPTASEIHGELADFHKAIKHGAEYLCLVGWPDALPMAVISHGQGIDADLVSDLPFAQTDEDPFVDLSHARFIAEDLESATLLACRGFARDDFPQRHWAQKFATAEWEELSQTTLPEAGLDFAGHHEGEKPFDEGSALAQSGLILHSSHAMWTEMGKTYLWDSNTLLAPAMVVSGGCSTASLDQDDERRSVASRLLKNGAVAFVGNSRRGIAQQELFRTEFLNALFAGNSLGAAQRIAQNYVLLAMMEKGQTESGPYFYQMYHQLVFGDPALRLGLRFAETDPPARAQVNGTKVRVVGPKKWHRMEYIPLEEWGCVFPKLWAWRGSGIGVESRWHPADKRDEEQLLFHITVHTRRKVNSIKPLSDVPESLGWTGSCGVDHHADGSRSLYWRVRLIDADKTTGEVRAQVEELDFKLIRD
jgi:hypothetical protein